MSKTGETTIKFIEVLLKESTALLSRHGETRAHAEKLSREFVVSYFRKVSGQGSLYFRKDLKFEAQSKRKAIRAEFLAGSTVFQLSDKYKLTTVRIYQIIKQEEIELTETDTSLKAPLLIEAVRMFLKAGIEKEDATIAARGLIAVVLVRFSGIIISVPKPDAIKTIIAEIRKNHSTVTPDSSELPRIKTHLFNMAENFRDHVEINALLESATEKINRVEGILARLK